MPDFTQKVETAEGCYDISFKESVDQSSEYLVTIVEDDNAVPPFAMRFTDGCWKILNAAQLSFWVL